MKKRNLYISLLILTVLLSALLLRPHKDPGSTADPDAQRLHLQYEPGDGAPTNIVKSDTLNGHYEGNLFFVALQNVTIQLNGKYVLLETAIREGDISGFDRAGRTSQIAGRCGHRPLREEGKNPAGPIGVSRVKNTCYTARKNFTRNRAEMA